MPVPDVRGILLAAGGARRFGSPKLLQPLAGDVPIAVQATRRLLRALPESIAVIRPEDEALRTLLAAEGIGIISNRRAEEGVGTSLACGVNATPDAGGWVIALADMPFIREKTIAAVARAIEEGAAIAAPVFAGQRGHPVGFARRFFAELATLSGDHGARHIIDRYKERVALLAVDDPHIHRDVDTLSDLRRPA